MKKHLFDIDLQLFAEGAAAEPAPSAGESPAAVPASTEGATAAGSAASEPMADPAVQRQSAWEKARSEYRDLYEHDTEALVTSRLKKAKEELAQHSAASKLTEKALRPLYEYYGIKAGDIDALNQAIRADDQLYEPKAIEAGMSTKAYKELAAMREELNETREEKQRREASERQQNEMRQQIENWRKEEAALKAEHPEFDFTREYKENQAFKDLISRKVDMASAYAATHYKADLEAAVKQGQEKALQSVMANGQRPAENGLANTSTAILSDKPLSQMTREERDDYVRKSMRRRR